MKEWDNDVHEQALQRRANKELDKAKARLNEEYELIREDEDDKAAFNKHWNAQCEAEHEKFMEDLEGRE